MYGFTLILTLAIVGGVIAYIGDRLGMNVGRKKLTLFGLRPKHTSILVTIVTGVFIASASIGVLSIASQDVRIALFSMKEIQEELQGLQDNYAEMRGQRDLAQLELQEAEGNLAQTEERYNQIIVELSEAEKDVQLLRSQAETLENEVTELMATTDQLREYSDLVVQQYGLVETAFGQIRQADIAFNASEVILTTVIEDGLSREEVQAALEDFVHEVDDEAYRRSARAPESDTYQAVFLQPGVVDFVVEDVLFTPGDVVVRAVSEGNSIPGVPVLVYLETFPDQMVFSRGTVLASNTWDPSSGIGIDRIILQILNEEANSMALNAGMSISREWGGAVLLPGGHFLDALEASTNIHEPVQIRLVVEEDTWRSTSPVVVYLELEPV